MGPKSENVGFTLVLPLLFEVSRLPRGDSENEQPSEPDRFEVQKVILLIKNALWLYSELCFLLRRGAQFQKFHENKVPESEKWSRKTVDGKCDGCILGLGGAKKRICQKWLGFTITF